MAKIKKFSVIVLVLILVAQTSILLIIGNQKKSYFLDDVWTLEITQGSYDFVSDDYAEKWNTEKELKDKTKINEDERFNLLKVEKAVERDTVHPPLYYYILNIIGSIFISIPLSNLALYLNIVISLLITIVLFFLFRRMKYLNFLSRSELIKNNNDLSERDLNRISDQIDLEKRGLFSGLTDLIPSLVWAFMPGAIRMVVLYRMYLMLILFSALTLYFALGVLSKLRDNDKDLRMRDLVFLMISLACGFLTHFYFSFYSFFVVLILIIVCITKCKFKELFMVGGGALFSLLAAHLTYPKLIYFILFSYQTGNAFKLFTFTFPVLCRKTYVMTRILTLNLVPNKMFSLFLTIVLLVFFIVFIANRLIAIFKKHRGNEHPKSIKAAFIKYYKSKYDSVNVLVFAPLVIFLIFLIIFSYTASNRYISVLFLLPVLLLSNILYRAFIYLKQNAYLIIIQSFVVIFFIANSLLYTQNEYPVVDKKLEKYHDYPALVVMKAFSTWGEYAYGAFIESILPVLQKFPAEIHAREDMFMSNLLGMKDKDYKQLKIDPVTSLDPDKVNIKYPLKNYKKYSRNKNDDDKLVLFIEDETLLKRNEIINILMKRLNFSEYKSIDLVNQWNFKFFVFVLSK